MTTSNKTTIKLSRIFSNSLALRDNADHLFDRVESSQKKEIVLDFHNVNSMSRSFAHQYLLRKAKTRKKIVEIGKKEEFDLMFKRARRKREPARIKIGDIKIFKL